MKNSFQQNLVKISKRKVSKMHLETQRKHAKSSNALEESKDSGDNLSPN